MVEQYSKEHKHSSKQIGGNNMPRRDGTGPQGQGPRTGRGFGRGQGRRDGQGQGQGRNMGQGNGTGPRSKTGNCPRTIKEDK